MALHKEEDTMGKLTRLLILATLLLVTVVVGLGACSWRMPWAAAPTDTPQPQAAAPSPIPPTATPRPKSTNTPGPQPPPAQIILQRALDALAGLDSWHLEVEMPLIAKFRGVSIEVPARYVGDYRAHGRIEGEFSLQLLGLLVEKELIFESESMHMKDQAGGGRLISREPSNIITMMKALGFDPSDIEGLEVVGTETLDGVEVYHLIGRVPVEDMQLAQDGVDVAIEGELQFDLWTGVDDALPRQVMVGGEMDVTGLTGTAAEATLQVVGTATLSDFGVPAAAAQSKRMLVETDDTRCGADGQFVEYKDEERAISFCYPAASVVDDTVDACSPFVVSPEGVALGNEIPDSMVMIYPDEQVEKFLGSASGATEITGRMLMCTLRFLVGAVIGDGQSLVELYKATPTPTPTPAPGEGPNPLVIQFTGIYQGDALAVSISYVLDEAKYGPTVDTVTGSVNVRKPPD
jgi:hypothetical protein